VIARIKNKHLRRLAVVAIFSIYIAISPFVVLVTELPGFLKEMFDAARTAWGQPRAAATVRRKEGLE
jgi:hypothetical protein